MGSAACTSRLLAVHVDSLNLIPAAERRLCSLLHFSLIYSLRRDLTHKSCRYPRRTLTDSPPSARNLLVCPRSDSNVLKSILTLGGTIKRVGSPTMNRHADSTHRSAAFWKTACRAAVHVPK